MKTTMNTMLMLMLACTISATAQTNMSGDSSMKKSDQKMGKQMSMTGCIAEKDGKYMMMNKAHPDGVQLMSSEDLKPHVGHKMRATGKMEKMEGMSGDSMKSSDMKSGDEMKHEDMGMMEMKVTGMKMVSERCDMSKMMH